MAKTTTLRKFKVLAGFHAQHGRVYKAGDIVESAHDLCAQFLNKFDEMPSMVPATKSQLSSEIGGRQGQGLPVAMLQNADAKLTGKDAAVDPLQDDADDDGQTGDITPQGQDVTEKFTKASEQDLKVFKHEGSYFLYDEDDLTKPIGSGVKKTEVDGAVEKWLKAGK